MGLPRSLVASGLLLGILSGGCDSGDVCDPGQQNACTCPGGATGSRACLQDGSGWDTCQCCQPDCAGKNCGSDGCEGICGECTAPQTCNAQGVCECTPDCGVRECGPDPVCGASCGVCTAPDDCSAQGACECAPACGGQGCGPDPVCHTSCGECTAPAICTAEHQCCSPDCAGRQCGADPVCGASCGECTAPDTCNAQGICECIPFCSGNDCLSDGCYGTCVCPGCNGEPAPELCQYTGQCGQYCCPDCAGKECGDDGCAGSCGICDEVGSTCDLATATCTHCTPDCAGKECGDDGCGGTCGSACEPGQVCDPEIFLCVCDVGPACLGLCGGDDGCGGTCSSICAPGATCDPATLLCETGCCQDQQVYVDGRVVDLTTGQGVGLEVGVLTPMGFITGANFNPLETATSYPQGAFKTSCLDATSVSFGLVVVADDPGFDGDGGIWFPTGTGVIGWGNAAEKVCVEDAEVFAVPNTLVAVLEALPDFDAAAGFVLGVVADSQGTPLQDAVVEKTDGTDLASIYYPSASFDDFTGTSTSATGVFLIPGPLAMLPVRAVLTGYEFQDFAPVAVAGYCYFLSVRSSPP